MTSLFLRRLLPAVWAAAAWAVQAQPAPRLAKPEPADAKASVPALVYESPFARYRRLGEDRPISWREANDTVARIGGWRVYLREAQQPASAPASPPAKPAP